jgi:Holliday junction resolvase
MSSKKKKKMHTEEIEVIVVEAPVKNEAELQKVRENTEEISEFAEKVGDRYEIRMKFDKILWYYLTEIELVLPILDKIIFKEFYMNLMEIFFYISIFILLFQIII